MTLAAKNYKVYDHLPKGTRDLSFGLFFIISILNASSKGSDGTVLCAGLCEPWLLSDLISKIISCVGWL